jgi:RNA polymerase sigma factor (sigma-70 family)
MTNVVSEPQTTSEFAPPQFPTPHSFEQLALPLLESAHKMARFLTRDPDEAQDLTQETYLKALRAFTSFQPGTNFRAWIFQIMRNTFLSTRTSPHWRCERATEIENLLSQLPSPESLLIDSCERYALKHAIEELPAAYRQVVLLRDVEEISYREISTVLSIPIGTVMSRLARARKILRDTASPTHTLTGAPSLFRGRQG